MIIKQMMFIAIVFSMGYCHATFNKKMQQMNQIIEHQPEKYFIGLELRTNNEECSSTIPAHKDRFFKEETLSKIPNRINENILALYTDYEGDYTKPYSWILGCEVSSLEHVPSGLVGKVIPESDYAVFITQGEFPQGLIATWQEIWKANLPRSYTTDYEVYRPDFDPQRNPEVKVCIAINDIPLKAVLQGRQDFFCPASLCSSLPQTDFRETNKNHFYVWGIDYACHNGVIEKDGNRIPTEEEIDETIAYFSAKNVPFMWWSSAKILEKKGFQFGGILKGVAIDISKELPSGAPSSSDLKIKIVQSESELEKFTVLAGNAFGLTSKAIEQWIPVNKTLMKSSENIHLMAYVNDAPVGTATLSLSPSSAGIWNLSTLPEYRKQGVGSALVRAALVEAKNRQHQHVMAVLMPKGLAWGLLNKLGFEAVCEFPFYVYGFSTEELEK